MNCSNKLKILYWGIIVFFSLLYQLTLRTWNLNFITSSLEFSMLFFTACIIGFRIFGVYKFTVIKIIAVMLVGLCFPPIMHITSVISNVLVFMNGLNEYPQPITNGTTILYALAFTIIALKICAVRCKLHFPRGKHLLICFIPFFIFIVIGVLLTLICGDGFRLTNASSFIIYDYNTYFSFVFVDITIGLGIYEMLKYNKGR